MTRVTVVGRCPACHWNDVDQPEMQAHLPRHYVLLTRYYMGRVLGQGGFGVTYLARDLRLDRPVAIKEYMPMEQCTRQIDRITVRSHGGDRQVQYAAGLKRFLEEAKSLAQFESHPCIVSISDYAEANGTAYLVMGYLEGMTLKQYLANHGGRIPYTQAIQILMPVMDALREVHKHGLLHRDVSPDNIFLTRSGHVKLLDFGAARYAIGEQSQSLSMILKPGFAPEEQYRTRGKQGPWTDVYAVGATIYRCITGQVPPSAPDRMAEDDLTPPSRIARDVPPLIESALLKAMAVSAANRFQTVDQFQQALMVTPVVQPPQPPVYPPPVIKVTPPTPPPPPPPPKPPVYPPAAKVDPPPPPPTPPLPVKPGLSGGQIGALVVLAAVIGIGVIWLIVKASSSHPTEPVSTGPTAQTSDNSSNPGGSSSPSGGSTSGPTEQPLPAPSQGGSAQTEPPPSTPPLQGLVPPKTESAPDVYDHPEKSPKYSSFLAEERSNTYQSSEVATAWAALDVMMDDISTKLTPGIVTLYLKNECPRTIKVAVTFQIKVPGDAKWGTVGWRIVGPNQTIDSHLVTNNRVLYAYAESLDGQSVWNGNDESNPDSETLPSDPLFFQVEGKAVTGANQKTVKMFTKNPSAFGDYSINFTCPAQ